MSSDSGQEPQSQLFDPFEPFRRMRDVYLEQTAKYMVEAVNTPGYAQATGMMLDSYLSWAVPIRQAMEKVMTSTLEQLSLPSRQQVVSLAERQANLEMRLDDMDAKLDEIAEALRGETQKKRAA